MNSRDETTLLRQLRRFEIGDADMHRSFIDRLALENNWSLSYANRTFAEYKRFMFLIVSTSENLTPSDAVDVVWHLHLSYTHSYWHEFCDGLLGQPVHHGPTKGTSEELSKFKKQYQATLEHYSAIFNSPPNECWPSVEDRFSTATSFKRIDLNRYWLVKKGLVNYARVLLTGGIIMIIGSCTVSLGATTSPIALTIVCSIIVGLMVIALAISSSNYETKATYKKTSSGVSSTSGVMMSDTGAGGGDCGGGCGSC